MRGDVTRVSVGGTPQLCQNALIREIEELFKGNVYNGQEGYKALKIFKQDLPIPEDEDEDSDTDAAAAPYIVVRMTGGEVKDERTPQTIDFSIVICTYDRSVERLGYQDVANIKEDMIQHFCKRPYFGDVYTVLKPITWAMQADDSAPYYFGAVSLTCTAPAMTQDEELGDLV